MKTQSLARGGATLAEQASVSSEDQIVARFLDAASNESFTVLFRFYVPSLIRYFRFRGCVLALAEDLAQEVMLAVYREAAVLRDRKHFRAWIYQIAHKTLLQTWRKGTREVKTVGFLWASGVEGNAGNPLEASILRESIMAIKPEEREILGLRWIDGLELHEIAAVLGIPLGTVQWKVFRIRQKLAALVK